MRIYARAAAGTVTMGISLVLCGSSVGAGPPPEIISGPTVAKAGTEHAITFAVSRPCDVTVRITSASGEVIRHVASGMVGLERAAEPFVPDSLEQEVTWDGKDDSGKPAPAGCRVHVMAGMEAKFDKFILWEKDGIGGEARIDPGRPGEYIVTQSGGYHTNTTRIFDREGKFIRQLWPYHLDQKNVSEFLADPLHGADDWDGNRVPVSVNHNASYYFGTKMSRPAMSTDGYLVGVADWSVGSVGLNCVTPQGLPNRHGGWAYDSPATVFPKSEPTETSQRKRPPWYADGKVKGIRALWACAAGLNGDFYLADGISHVVGRFRASDFTQLPFADDGKMLIGEVGKADDDEEHFLGPNDITVGTDGSIYILDGADTNAWGLITLTDRTRVKVYSADGSFMKFLDANQFPKPPVPDAVTIATKNPRALDHPHFLRVDPAGVLYVANKDAGKRVIKTDIDGESFEIAIELPYGHDLAHGYHGADRDGNWYVSVRPGSGESNQLWKFSSEGERLKFEGKDAITIAFDEPARNSTAAADVKGVYVARNGDVYLVNAVEKWTTPRFLGSDFHYGDLMRRGDQYNATRVDAYDAEGNLKKKNLIRSQGLNDVAVDRDGNIYVIEATMYHGAHQRRYAKREGPLPFSYLTEEQSNLDPTTEWNKRFSLTARLMKFSPEGGVMDGEGGKPQLWSYAGVSGLSPQGCGGECHAGQICLDADERIWVPDTFMYCIKAIDKAGNEIIRVGKYGNEDCRSGGGDKKLDGTTMIIDPEIPLARPSGIAVYRDYLLISDMYAHRVLRARLEYTDTKEAALSTDEPGKKKKERNEV